ncbi:MAG: H+transporting two-sector ATPase delta/epsilon subunit [Ignavibacteria bacterium]|nr:H+transporting two-sector ATPase delta/epsilon subunit [Ignavibacteria bacterium]
MSENKLQVDIITPQKVIYSGEAESVTLPGSKSPFQVLINHAPIVSSLDNGKVKVVETGGKSHSFSTTDGFAEVAKNKVSVLVESAEEV